MDSKGKKKRKKAQNNMRKEKCSVEKRKVQLEEEQTKDHALKLPCGFYKTKTERTRKITTF